MPKAVHCSSELCAKTTSWKKEREASLLRCVQISRNGIHPYLSILKFFLTTMNDSVHSHEQAKVASRSAARNCSHSAFYPIASSINWEESISTTIQFSDELFQDIFCVLRPLDPLLAEEACGLVYARNSPRRTFSGLLRRYVESTLLHRCAVFGVVAFVASKAQACDCQARHKSLLWGGHKSNFFGVNARIQNGNDVSSCRRNKTFTQWGIRYLFSVGKTAFATQTKQPTSQVRAFLSCCQSLLPSSRDSL